VGQARLHYLLDHTDDPVIPRRGFSAESNFRWFDQSPGANGGFPSMDLKLGYFQPIIRPASIFLEAKAAPHSAPRATGIPQFFLAGPCASALTAKNEFHGNQYYLFRAGYLHDLLILPPFLGKKVYAVGSYEFGKMLRRNQRSEFPNDVAAGLLAETGLGPVLYRRQRRRLRPPEVVFPTGARVLNSQFRAGGSVSDWGQLPP